MKRFLVLSVVIAAPAQAQEIIVTAERRAAPADRIAASVSVLDGQEIARIAPEHPAEALNRLPGVYIHRNNGLESLPAIRSPVLVGGQAAGSFLVLEDGVPIRSPAFGNVNQVFETALGFAGAVEVTRGPGSALYGSNAVHGLINVLTPAPSEAGRSVAVEAGEYDRFSGQALAGIASGYVGVSLAHEGGYRAASGFDKQDLLAGWAGEALGFSVDARVFAQNLNQETAGFIQGENAFADEAIARSNPTPEAYRDQRLIRAHARLERNVGEVTLAVTPYARFIETDLLLSFLPSRAQEITRQKGGGAQAAVYWDPSPSLSLIFGLDAEYTRGALSTVQSLPTITFNPSTPTDDFPQGVQYDYEVDAAFLAGFGQARWAFAPAWAVTAGLRVEHAAFDYTNLAPDGDFGRLRRPADRSDDFTYALPKLSLLRALPGGGAGFMNYAAGARAPQAVDLYSLQVRQNPGEQDPETIQSFEAGVRLPIGPARVELVGFRLDKADTSFRSADGFTVQDAQTRHQGVELSLAATLPAGFSLNGWTSYSDQTYESSSPADGVVEGNRIDTAPEWLSNLRVAFAPNARFDAELEWVRVGEYFTDAANARRYPGHDLFNLRARFGVSDALEATFALRNLTDEAYAERADFAFGNDRYFPGEPRRWSVGLRYRG